MKAAKCDEHMIIQSIQKGLCLRFSRKYLTKLTEVSNVLDNIFLFIYSCAV